MMTRLRGASARKTKELQPPLAKKIRPLRNLQLRKGVKRRQVFVTQFRGG